MEWWNGGIMERCREKNVTSCGFEQIGCRVQGVGDRTNGKDWNTGILE